MIDNCYTFKELCQKYNWNTTMASIDGQIKFVLARGVEIEVAFKKGSTYFRIIQEIKLYTFEELCNKYNWGDYPYKQLAAEDRIKYAYTKGVEIEFVMRHYSTNKYKIIRDISNNRYTWKEICEKYKWNSNSIASTVETRIKYAKKRGVILESLGTTKAQTYFSIIDDNIYNATWYSFNKYPTLEMCKEGYIRNKKSKLIYTATNSNGYISFQLNNSLLLVHRVLMEVFNPIENMESYTVDHIDGVRSNNNISNLRWTTQSENTLLRIENRKEINDKVMKLLQKYGYEKLNEILNNLLKNR